VVALCAFAASAQGATIVETGFSDDDPSKIWVTERISLDPGGFVNDVTMTSAGDTWVFTDPGGLTTPVDAGNLCTQTSRQTAVCPADDSDSVAFSLGGKDDRVKLPQTPGLEEAYVDLGRDDDTLRAGPEATLAVDGIGDDVVHLGAGDDSALLAAGENLVEGGAGNDSLDSDNTSSSDGATTLNGGGGADSMSVAGDQDTARGGAGADVLFSFGRAKGARLSGGAGADALYSEGSIVGSCGGGTDSIFPEANDLVSTDCEDVSYFFECGSTCTGELTVTGKLSSRSGGPRDIVLAHQRFRLSDGAEIPGAKLRDSAVARLLRGQDRARVTQTVSYVEGGDRRSVEDQYFLNDKRRNIKAP
jgi:hypothetical protein